VGDSGKLLFVRWISIGAFFPFFRLHSMIDSRDNEPWSYGEWCEAVARNYIRLRYRLMPYLYTRIEESNRLGLPVLRPYFWEKAALEYEPAFQHQFFFGPDILVIPAASEQAAVWADLPDGNWFHLFSGKKFAGNQALWLPAPPDSVPVLVREGAILVTGTVGNSTKEVYSDGLDIHLFYSQIASSGSLYCDDGESRQTLPHDCRRLIFSFDPEKINSKFIRNSAKSQSWFERYTHGTSRKTVD
jgi:alpha-glucosidase